MVFEKIETVTYSFSGHFINVLVPETKEVANWFRKAKESTNKTIDPYWTKVWPASIGICDFLSKNLHLIRHKRVLEIAAGLGLPSLWASHYAATVICSDYLPEAVSLMKQSAKANNIKNIECCLLDWNHLPHNLETDVLLLSDINYEQVQFEQLLKVINQFVNAGTMVILSTPQRMVGKEFIERLLPLAQLHEQVEVWHEERLVPISVLVLAA